MTEFDERLKRAIERGHGRSDSRTAAERAAALSEEDLKSLHGKYRLMLSEHIESCIEKLTAHFPGFEYKTTYGEAGWGAACSRDDFGQLIQGKRANLFSRLEMAIRPYSTLHVLELAAKGTVRNKEIFNRTHFEKIEEADTETFKELIDVWVLEYAEMYAANA